MSEPSRLNPAARLSLARSLPVVAIGMQTVRVEPGAIADIYAAGQFYFNVRPMRFVVARNARWFRVRQIIIGRINLLVQSVPAELFTATDLGLSSVMIPAGSSERAIRLVVENIGKKPHEFVSGFSALDCSQNPVSP